MEIGFGFAPGIVTSVVVPWHASVSVSGSACAVVKLDPSIHTAPTDLNISRTLPRPLRVRLVMATTGIKRAGLHPALSSSNLRLRWRRWVCPVRVRDASLSHHLHSLDCLIDGSVEIADFLRGRVYSTEPFEFGTDCPN